jgi:hypothetical protein
MNSEQFLNSYAMHLNIVSFVLFPDEFQYLGILGANYDKYVEDLHRRCRPYGDVDDRFARCRATALSLSAPSSIR